MMFKGRKGIFFTFVAILIVSILVMAFSSQSYITLKERTPVIESRVSMANSYIENLDSVYLERSLYIAGYRAIYSLILYENKTKSQFAGKAAFDCAFSNAMLYGTLFSSSSADTGEDEYFTTTPDLGSNAGATPTSESFGSATFLAQLFVPSASGNLENATFQLKWGADNNNDVVVELRDSNCNGVGFLLDNASIPGPGNSGWRTVTASFSKTPYIVSGQSYYFVSRSNTITDVELGTNNNYLQGALYNIGAGVTGTKIDSITGQNIMNGTTFTDRLELIKNKSFEVYAIRTDFASSQSLFSPAVYQSNKTGPWRIGVNITVAYTIDAGIAAWNRSKTVETSFDVYGLDDPLYLVKTQGAETNKIYEANFTKWNVTNLYRHLHNRTYRADQNASSFLMRFYSDYSRSKCCGIESAVSPDVVSLLGAKQQTYIDCGYFSDGAGCSFGALSNITGITNTTYPFMLDSYHVVSYNVSEQAVGS